MNTAKAEPIIAAIILFLANNPGYSFNMKGAWLNAFSEAEKKIPAVELSCVRNGKAELTVISSDYEHAHRTILACMLAAPHQNMSDIRFPEAGEEFETWVSNNFKPFKLAEACWHPDVLRMWQSRQREAEASINILITESSEECPPTEKPDSKLLASSESYKDPCAEF